MVSFFGGSTVQIGGPTGAFIVIVYNIIAQFGLHGLAIATFMAGVILGEALPIELISDELYLSVLKT